MSRIKFRVAALVLVSFLSAFCTPPAAGQVQVKVVNTTKSPVPTLAQGITAISGNVKITNASLPVSGSVNVTNSSLPITGTVDVNNLPLDANGNLLTTVVASTTQYQYLSIVAAPCINGGVYDFCANSGSMPIEQTLTTYSSEGYDLFSVTPSSTFESVGSVMVYTLRAPVAGAHKRTSQ
jgi:hypothetical protein